MHVNHFVNHAGVVRRLETICHTRSPGLRSQVMGWALALASLSIGSPDVCAQGQAQASDPAINNLVHPAGTATAPLGQLGHVKRLGTGSQSIILIPGAAFDWTIWQGFMARNAERYSMYAVTIPGYGGTPPPPMPSSTDYSERTWTNALCSALIELIDRERLDKPLVVGHHMHGDHYALRIGLEHADKVAGVVVVAGAPTRAFPGPGNAMGKPVVFASQEQRHEMVHGYWLDTYRHVTPQLWRANSYQARLFCKNERRAKELFVQQVSVPIPTQVRYALEYLTTDTSRQLGALSVPLLVVQPRVEWTFDKAMEAMQESNNLMFANLQEAESFWRQMVQVFWGDINKGIRLMFDGGYQWEVVRMRIPDVRIKYIDDSGIFVMEDQPAQLDDLIQEFGGLVACTHSNTTTVGPQILLHLRKTILRRNQARLTSTPCSLSLNFVSELMPPRPQP